MKIVSEHRNPLPDLVELKTVLSDEEIAQGDHKLLTELRIHPHEFEEDQIGSIKIEIAEAILSLELCGLEIVPKTKFGQPTADLKDVQEADYECSLTKSFDQERNNSGGANASASPASLTGGLELKHNSTQKTGEVVTEKVTMKKTAEHLRVRAIGNDNWRISEPGSLSLDAVYIDFDPLCEVKAQAKSNRTGVETELQVRQKDLRISVSDSSFFGSKSRNIKKVGQILIAKSLHSSSSSEPFDGVLILGKSQSFDEG